LQDAAQAAERGPETTAAVVLRLGRTSYLGARAVGAPDAGGGGGGGVAAVINSTTGSLPCHLRALNSIILLNDVYIMQFQRMRPLCGCFL
jgi:hypothetical protein